MTCDYSSLGGKIGIIENNGKRMGKSLTWRRIAVLMLVGFLLFASCKSDGVDLPAAALPSSEDTALATNTAVPPATASPPTQMLETCNPILFRQNNAVMEAIQYMAKRYIAGVTSQLILLYYGIQDKSIGNEKDPKISRSFYFILK